MRYLVLALLCLAANIAYVQRNAISVPIETIKTELAIGDRTMGLILAAWYWGYALFQVPSGWLADRWGSRRALVFYSVLWSILTSMVGLAAEWSVLLLLWTLMGSAQAGVFPCSARSIGVWFPEGQRALASGLLGASMALGIALAPLLTSRLLTRISWQQVFVLFGLPGLAWALLFFLLTSESPKAHPETPRRPFSLRAEWGVMVGSLSLWLLCAQQFLRAAAMVFFGTWFPLFLQKTRGVSQLEAGTLTFWMGIGAMLGGLAGGFVSDWLLYRTGNRRLSRQGIAVLGMTIACTLVLGSSLIGDTYLAAWLLGLATFSGTFGGVSGYSVTIYFGGSRVATVFSVVNTWGNIGASLFPLVVGWLVESYQNWNMILYLFASLFAADAVCWALLNPRRPLFEDNH